jgi:hypothetical protein
LFAVVEHLLEPTDQFLLRRHMLVGLRRRVFPQHDALG